MQTEEVTFFFFFFLDLPEAVTGDLRTTSLKLRSLLGSFRWCGTRECKAKAPGKGRSRHSLKIPSSLSVTQSLHWPRAAGLFQLLERLRQKDPEVQGLV